MEPYDIAALALRLMVSVDYLASGVATVRNPAGRGKLEGMPAGFMMFIGAAEIAGGAGLVSGVLARWAALGLIAIMVGAIYRKIFVSRTGFWGKDGYGWSYDLRLTTMLLMIALVGPGRIALLPQS